MTWSYEPDEYEVDVEYNSKTYKFDDKKIYNKYFEMVGSTVKATLVTYEYDDGTTSTEITELR